MSATPVFSMLRALLRPHADGMTVKADTADNYYLEESWSGTKPQMFGAVQQKKSYTALHLFPVYTHPELLDDLSPELRKRMHGKSCFNFSSEDQVRADELETLIRRCRAKVQPA